MGKQKEGIAEQKMREQSERYAERIPYYQDRKLHAAEDFRAGVLWATCPETDENRECDGTRTDKQDVNGLPGRAECLKELKKSILELCMMTWFMDGEPKDGVENETVQEHIGDFLDSMRDVVEVCTLLVEKYGTETLETFANSRMLETGCEAAESDGWTDRMTEKLKEGY